VKTNLKLAKLWLDRKEYIRLSEVSFAIGINLIPFSSHLAPS